MSRVRQEFPKGDIQGGKIVTQLPIRSVLRETRRRATTKSVRLETLPAKKRPKGDAGCARSFLKGGRHASYGKYPVSYGRRRAATKASYGMCRTHSESFKGNPGTHKSLKEDVQSKHRLVTQAVHKSNMEIEVEKCN
ncbi:hypothetical protein Prudu_014140 [Prunus dulcis]|uniref:Uncharacterized protein n=1 Tax=Prunus dulcis TaxID=3755 RepID=A0A4Y1RGJ2_PRUDU|nr:hypothetical protein Prudu_014140 [Prunus dulcis]